MALLWRREVLNYGHLEKDSVIFCQKQWKKKKKIQNIGCGAVRAGSPANTPGKNVLGGQSPPAFWCRKPLLGEVHKL